MTKNVIEFPKSKIVRDVPFDDEDIARAKEKNKQRYGDEIVADFSEGMYAELEGVGLNTESLEFTKDFIYLTDVLRALVYRNLGIPHALHEYIDKKVKIRTLPLDASPEDVEKLMQEMIEEYGNAAEITDIPTVAEIAEMMDDPKPIR